MKLAWIMLLLAGVFEIGWPVGLKNGYSEGSTNLTWIGFAIICMAISGTLLFMAQKTIPIGTAYAVWTGIGSGRNLYGWNLVLWRWIFNGQTSFCFSNYSWSHRT